MDGLHPRSTVRTTLSFLLLILIQTPGVAVAQGVCAGPPSVEFPENNAVGEVVAVITVEPGVTLEFSPSMENPNPFALQANQLTAAKVFDYETEKTHIARITCTDPTTNLKVNIIIVVALVNKNDNPPFFNENPYRVSVPELSPVGTTVGNFAAVDLDQLNQLYYTLTSESDNFELMSPTIPSILIKTPLNYDKVKNVSLVLFVQDTPLATTDGRSSFTTNTTIIVSILDSDNRPPWFQPCTIHEVGGASVCQSAGYTSKVNLNEQKTGVLPLKPGPLHAIDGDSGINEEITYSILSGNNEAMFEINASTGSIRMLKPASKLEAIILTVMAAQKRSSYQFSTTTVTISVQKKSLQPPKFQRPLYQAVINGVGTMALDQRNTDQPLQILATDDDYTTTGGLNPYIDYSIVGNSDFSIINGFLYMTKHLSDATLSLQVVAKDTSNDESAVAQLSVEVKTGPTTTTSLPLNTTVIKTTTSTGLSTTNSKTTEVIVSTTNPGDSSTSATVPSSTSKSITSTTDSSMSTEGSTTNPSTTSEGNVSTTSATYPLTAIAPSGDFSLEDMVALGATLGALLLICLVVIALLVYRMRKGKGDWRKIYETNMFRSNLGQGSDGLKEAIQYTNEAFQNDEDEGSMGPGGPKAGSVTPGRDTQNAKENVYAEVNSLAPLFDLLSDNTSQAGSDKSDNEKVVKPILTKERRMEDGYKAVWFKGDIDPNAKEDVVIIPDSREDDSEDEDKSSNGREEEGYENKPRKSPKVGFTDVDLDSGVGVRMDDLAEDSDRDLSSDI